MQRRQKLEYYRTSFGQPKTSSESAVPVTCTKELLQENEGKLHPRGYAKKKLSLAEAKYPIIKKECLAVVWGITGVDKLGERSVGLPAARLTLN